MLVGGLPGTGKSTLSRGLGQAANFSVIRSDEVRKELAGVPVTEKAEGIYTPLWTQRTYAECRRRAWRLMADNRRVIVDATFVEAAERGIMQSATCVLGIPAVFLVCRADPALVRERLRARRGDASDADECVYDDLAAKWEPSDAAATSGKPSRSTRPTPGGHSIRRWRCYGTWVFRRTGFQPVRTGWEPVLRKTASPLTNPGLSASLTSCPPRS